MSYSYVAWYVAMSLILVGHVAIGMWLYLQKLYISLLLKDPILATLRLWK